MSGWTKGVQALLREKYPQAIYVHCHAHRPNLVSVDNMKFNQEVSILFGIVQFLYSYILESNTRNDLLKKTQNELGQKELSIEHPSTTRWF